MKKTPPPATPPAEEAEDVLLTESGEPLLMESGEPLTLEVDRALAHRYLAEAGITAEAALVALVMVRDPAFPYARERVSEDELLEMGTLGEFLVEADDWARYGWRGDMPPEHLLSPELAERLRAVEKSIPHEEREAYLAAQREAYLAATAVAGKPAIPWPHDPQEYAAMLARLEDASPTYRRAKERREALDARCRLTPEELAERITARLTRADGSVAPAPAAWCTRQGVTLERLEVALFVVRHEKMDRELAEYREERERLRQENERLRKQQAPPLRLPTKAARTLSLRPRDKEDVLRRARAAKRLSKAEYTQWMAEKTFHATGDELLVVAGLLHYAREEGRLRTFEAASARVQGITLETRLPIVRPTVEELARLLGYPTTASGTVSGSHRRRVEAALQTLTRTVRPIIVRQRVRTEEGERVRWEDHDLLSRDVLVKESKDPTGASTFDLHPALANGYWWGHLTLHNLPKQWEAAAGRIGARKTTDPMKWGDFYFRRLVLGVIGEWAKSEGNRIKAELEAQGLGEQEVKTERARRMRQRRREYPELLEKTLKTATVLESLDLQDHREKQGPASTRKEVERVLRFAVEVEDCPLVGWAWEGSGTLPGSIRVTLRTPPRAEPEPVQEELFPALALGSGHEDDEEEEPVEEEE